VAFYLVQGGTSLYKMTPGGTATTLILPSTVSLASGKRLRGAVLSNLVVLVNSPSENITVDAYDTVRPLSLRPPGAKVTVSTAAGGSLSGSFKVKETFILKDPNGNVIAESDFGPASDTVSPTTQYITVVPSICNQDVRGSAIRKLYRTTTGPGSTYFPWFEADGNAALTFRDDLSDAGLQLIAAPEDLGTPPKFEIVVAWKNRLWGKSASAPDTLFQSGNGKPYAFPSGRTIPVPPINDDTKGITGFLPRKDELGVGKAGSLHKIAGTNENNFTRTTVADKVGIWATDSCQVISDVGYFLGNPFGIYKWDANGVKDISTEKVAAWFTTDTYFNRSMFDQAVGWYDSNLHAYCVLLAAVGSSNLDRWIMYDIAAGTWWGPHKTDAFTPTGGVTLRDANNILMPVLFASDGKLYKPTTTKTDGTVTPIDFECITNYLSGGTPGVFKTFLDPEIVTKIQSDGDLSVYPTVGKTNAVEGTVMTHDMTLGNERLPRLGDGELLKLRLRENTAAQAVVLYGMEIPFFENGRRS
jgi:hypothetical protein